MSPTVIASRAAGAEQVGARSGRRGTDGTDCWRRRTGSGRSVTAGVSCRSAAPNLRWLWWTYRCRTVLGSVTVWRTAQQIDSRVVSVSRITHSPPSSTSLQSSLHCRSSTNDVWLRSEGICARYSAAVTWPTITWQKTVETKSASRRQANADQRRQRAAICNSNWYKYICNYVNQRPQRT